MACDRINRGREGATDLAFPLHRVELIHPLVENVVHVGVFVFVVHDPGVVLCDRPSPVLDKGVSRPKVVTYFVCECQPSVWSLVGQADVCVLHFVSINVAIVVPAERASRCQPGKSCT